MTPTGEELRVDVEGRTLKISNLDKVLYPRTGTTKGEVLNYYAQVAPVLLPHLKDRAVTRIRWPHGVADKSFFEKNTPAGTPSWVRTAQGADDRVAGQLAARRPPGLPDRRRPGHADLAGQPGRAGAPRPPVDGQPQRPAAQPEPAGDRPRPRRAGRAPGVLRRRPAGARPARRARPRRPRRSPAAARACTSTPRCPASSTPRRRPGWPRRWPRSCRRSTRSWSPPP